MQPPQFSDFPHEMSRFHPPNLLVNLIYKYPGIINASVHIMYICMHAYTRVCICTCVHACMFVCVYVHVPGVLIRIFVQCQTGSKATCQLRYSQQ